MTSVQTVHTADGNLRDRAEALAAAASEADGSPALSDHLLFDLRAGGDAGFTALLISGPDSSDLAAYGQISASNAGAMLETIIHPRHRTRASDLLLALTSAARAAMDGRHESLTWWVTEPTSLHTELAASIGLRETRRLHLLRRPLPAERRSTASTRAFIVGADEDDWVRVNNRAFSGHAEQGGWTRETLGLREQESWFDPEGFRLHERDGVLAAFCWTKVHDPGTDHAEGEIYVIAADPDFHGLGLGRELTLAGLDHLADSGLRSAILYVAAENSAAVGLYESLGFEVAMTRAAFVGDVAPVDSDMMGAR